MKYSDMQRDIAERKADKNPPPPPIASADLPMASDTQQPLRFYRLTHPITKNGVRYDYGGHVASGKFSLNLLARQVKRSDGGREFEGIVEITSAEMLVRNAQVKGDRAALPPDVRDLVEQAEIERELQVPTDGVGI